MTPNRDRASWASPVIALDPAAYAADNTPAAIDLRDFQSATLLLGIGAGGIVFSGTNKIEFVLTHSFDGTNFVNVTDDDVVKDALAPASIANGIIRSLTAAHAAATLQKLGYIGGGSHLKLLADFSGTHGVATPIAAFVQRGLGALIGAA